MCSLRDAKKERISLPHSLRARADHITQTILAIRCWLRSTFTGQLGTSMLSRCLIFENTHFNLHYTIVFVEKASQETEAN